MNLLLTGDWHLRYKSPVNRLGDYFDDQMFKLEQLFEIAKENDCSYILQPGDLGHTHTWSDYLKYRFIDLWNHYEIPIICVTGQHDLRFHSLKSLERSSLKVLESAGVLTILDSRMPYQNDDLEFQVYGCSYGEDVPETELSGDDCFNILLIHRMIIRSPAQKLWPGQEDYATANGFLTKYKDFHLIVSGDNHNGFVVVSKDDRVLVNCGCLMRDVASKQMLEHKPFVVVYDTTNGEMKQEFIPVKPAEEILNRKKIEEVEERNEKLEAFISGLSSEYEIDLDFKKSLKNFLKNNKIKAGVKEIIEEVMT